jgi:hypothetical protein
MPAHVREQYVVSDRRGVNVSPHHRHGVPTRSRARLAHALKKASLGTVSGKPSAATAVCDDVLRGAGLPSI